MRSLLKADTVLLVLPKWTGQPSQKKSAWLGEAALLSLADAAYGVPAFEWRRRARGRAPQRRGVLDDEHARHHADLAGADSAHTGRPSAACSIGAKDGILLGEVVSQRNGQFMLLSNPSEPLQKGAAATHKRTILVLSDPDIIANHGFAAAGNAALAVATIKHLLTGSGPGCVRRNTAWLHHRTGWATFAAVPFSVHLSDAPGRDCDCTIAVGDAWTLRCAATGAAADQRRPPGIAAKHRQAGRIHRASRS